MAGTSIEKGAVSDAIAMIVTAGGPAAVIGAARYALGYRTDITNTVITQRAETGREELRQAGETERARLAQQSPPPQEGNN